MGGQMSDTVNLHRDVKGIRIATGTIVDADIAHASSSAKNEASQPSMTKRWNHPIRANLQTGETDGFDAGQQ